jgi:hypothetical protein
VSLRSRTSTGVVALPELSIGAAWGASGYAMEVGMNLAALAAGAANAFALQYAHHTATAFIVFGGSNFGLQAGAGLSSYTGMIHDVGA